MAKKPAKAKAPAFQFYAADYLADEHVQLMTLEEEGIYIRLLSYCWREGSVPSDIALLSRLCKNAPVDALKMVLPRFEAHPQKPDRLINKRLEQERRGKSEYHKERSETGRKGAKKRWSNRDSSAYGSANGSAIDLPLAKNSSSSSSSTTTSNNKKRDQRADKPRDPRLDHPALKAAIEAKGSYPHKDTWDLVIKVLGSEPDVTRLRECWVAWRARGYSPSNLGWCIDWYVNGIPATGATNGNDRQHRESSSERNARNLRENVAYINGLSNSGSEADREDPIGLLAAGV